jgi:hypothetical protein
VFLQLPATERIYFVILPKILCDIPHYFQAVGDTVSLSIYLSLQDRSFVLVDVHNRKIYMAVINYASSR